MKPRSSLNSARLVFELALIVLLLLVGLNYETLADRWALATFKPTAGTAQVADQIDLTGQAKGVLYRSRAQVDDKMDFNRDCETTPDELELGCYFHTRIYVLDISNASLAPEMEVAMAHELLHAEWDRCSANEQATLGHELEQVYAGLNDPSLKQRMAEYAQTEPGQEDNELHSILGTEYPTLTPALEAHYAQYFPDRSQIVAAHASYTGVFNNQSAALAAELAQIQSQKAKLSALNARMTNLRVGGDIDSYNALVPEQNSLADEINKEIATYSAGVDEYNALAGSLNSQTITNGAGAGP